MSRYLYGASVQGIQDFIFKTNVLREIVGASELVKGISNDFEQLSKLKDKDVLVNAAGNVKAIFEDAKLLQTVVLEILNFICKQKYQTS
jgi:phosphoenolpyruvate synthase/pyruvate phosphate dikinase